MTKSSTSKPKKKSKESTVLLERRFVPKGKFIMKEGDVGTTAFLIQSGKAAVYSESTGKKIEFAEMGVGQIVGEMALVFDQPRSATIEALEDCNLVVITRRVLEQKLERSDPMIRAIVPMLTKRILDTSNALIRKSSDVDDLIDTVNLLYQNVQPPMTDEQRKVFTKDVGPHLEAFLNSIKDFQKKHAS